MKNSELNAYNDMNAVLDQLLKKEGERLTLEAFTQTFYLPLLVLRNMGWGKLRLKRFAKDMIKQWEMFEEKCFTAQDIKEMIKEETGLDIDFKLDFANKKAKIKVVT